MNNPCQSIKDIKSTFPDVSGLGFMTYNEIAKAKPCHFGHVLHIRESFHN